MSRKYKFRDNDKLYFLSFAVINWIDLFIRRVYKDILIESLKYCTEKKDLDVYAYCIMSSHVHLIIGSRGNKLENIMRDFKSFTSTNLKQAIKEHPGESRKEWMIWMMERAGKKNSNNTDFQLWQQHNHPIVLDSNYLLQQKLDYIHNNPVEAGFVEQPQDYLYSSAKNYCGQVGLIEVILIE
jgi:putative transposase